MTHHEKLPLVQQPTQSHHGVPSTQRRRKIVWRSIPLVSLLLLCFFMDFKVRSREPIPPPQLSPAQCPQVEPLRPAKSSPALTEMEEYLGSEKFKNESVARLAGVIQIPSQSYDDLGPIGEDHRWDTMYHVAAYMEKTFPLVYSTLDVQKVNTHGLLYTWKGSNEHLKPTVLMAHQDVVPVAESTVNQWTHPPFSGHYDGTYVWGRGAVDCKNTLIAILEAVEVLIHAGFAPKRTLVISFGFDEETSGMEGAGHLAPAIFERYGKDGVAIIVDEGSGMQEIWGTIYGAPAVAEKGYIDVDVIVRMPGGHSSVPPPHNGIGVMAEFITMVEANLYDSYFDNNNPFLGLLQCGAAHAPGFPKEWKELLHSNKRDKLAQVVAAESDFFKYLFTTSVAVDVIGGGVKANALPERTTALINHRVNIGSHVSDVQAHLTKLATELADKYNLTLHAFNDEEETPSSISLVARSDVLEPAPVTPTNVDSLTPYSVLSGTTRALYGTDIVMSPGLSTGNTDTRYYWDLTSHIFRYSPGFDPAEDEELAGVHTVDERVSAINHVESVKWFSLFVRNMDEVELP